MNKATPCDNTSGHKGVNWCARKKRWRARICANGKRTNLGYFRDLEAASRSYERASKRLHGEFRRQS